MIRLTLSSPVLAATGRLALRQVVPDLDRRLAEAYMESRTSPDCRAEVEITPAEWPYFVRAVRCSNEVSTDAFTLAAMVGF